jgi:diadenosine tetraphosphate (Ap4A) HIT family hydrolase
MSSIFTKIVNKETKIAEDENFLAFFDVNQMQRAYAFQNKKSIRF